MSARQSTRPVLSRFARLRRGTRALLLASALLLPTTLAVSPVSAQVAGDSEDIVAEADARLRGYNEKNVILPGGSPALPYIAFIGLTILAAGVMFKSARRTHLD